MSHQILRLDIRDEIRSGGAPCSRIMESAAQLLEGDTLQLIAPFEPKPLYEVLGREGFQHESREIGGGDWEICFTKSSKGASTVPVEAPVASGADEGCGCEAEEVYELDVRGLEPPQPMVQILEAIESLPPGAVLRAHTDRQPLHLFDQLAARGFTAASERNPQGGHITVIRGR